MNKGVTAKQVVLISFFVDLVDIIVNVGVAIVTGSVVMLAELFQGIFDLIASGLLLVGLRRPKEEIFLWSLASASVMLFLASTLSFYFGLMRFLNPEPVESLFLAYATLTVNVLTNGYAFYLSVKRIAGVVNPFNPLFIYNEFRNSHLLMTKNTFVLDLMGMSAAIAGLLALIFYQTFGDIRYDGIGAMGIGVTLALLSAGLMLDIKRKKKSEVNVEH